MSSIGTILGLQPFEPKRQLILPYEGGEITLYVLDGIAYPYKLEMGSRSRRTINCVHFEGWTASFKNAKLDIPPELGAEYCALEVAFRLVCLPDGRGQTAEIVAVSYDGGKTFYNNELCTLEQEYAQPQKIQAS